MSGAVGLKPTHGLVPYTGVVSSEAICDYVGPICKDVLDTATLLEVIAGYDGIDDRSLGAQKHGSITYSANLKNWYSSALSLNGPEGVLKGMKVGILKESLESPNLQKQMKDFIYESACKLKELGAEVEVVSCPQHITGRDIWMGIRRLGGALNMLGHANGRRGFALEGYLGKVSRIFQ